MPISSRTDYLLRIIQQLAAAVARARGLRNDGHVPEALRTLDDAEGELLDAHAAVVPRVDSATAAHILADPQRIAAWARLLHERAELLRLAGDPAGAEQAARRAAELAREALARATGYETAVRELLGPLSASTG